jgi:hypothetical protein
MAKKPKPKPVVMTGKSGTHSKFGWYEDKLPKADKEQAELQGEKGEEKIIRQYHQTQAIKRTSPDAKRAQAEENRKILLAEKNRTIADKAARDKKIADQKAANAKIIEENKAKAAAAKASKK